LPLESAQQWQTVKKAVTTNYTSIRLLPAVLSTCPTKNLNTKTLKRSKTKQNQVCHWSLNDGCLLFSFLENEGEEEEKSEHGEEEAQEEVRTFPVQFLPKPSVLS
jgi:hypothetical protein